MRCSILVFLVACGGGAAKAPPAAPKVGPSCAKAADGMVGMLVTAMTPKPPDADVDGMRALIKERCDADHWSPEAMRCTADMKTADDANVCGTSSPTTSRPPS
ncbi:hypothetical protein BH11MYX3_BH11MYX3_00880 [soil metagenome]